MKRTIHSTLSLVLIFILSWGCSSGSESESEYWIKYIDNNQPDRTVSIYETGHIRVSSNFTEFDSVLSEKEIEKYKNMTQVDMINKYKEVSLQGNHNVEERATVFINSEFEPTTIRIVLEKENEEPNTKDFISSLDSLIDEKSKP